MAEGDLDRLLLLFGDEPDEDEVNAIRERNTRALEGAALGSALLTMVWQRCKDSDGWTDDALGNWYQRPGLPEDLVHAIENWATGDYYLVRAFLTGTDGR